MASLVRNGKNYGLRWSDADRTPSQVRESLKTESKKKALQKKSELEWKYLNGDHDPWIRKWYEKPKKKYKTLIELVEEFISYKSTVKGSEGWSEDVAEKETYTMRNYARVIGEHKPVDQITNKDMQRLYYRDGVTSNHTRNSDYISMNTFFNWCIKNKYLKTKPDFKPGKPQTKIPKFLTIKEFADIIQWRLDLSFKNLKENHILKPYDGMHWVVLGWMILAGTGMRPKELSLLKLHHIQKDSIYIGEDFTTKVHAERVIPMLFETKQAVDVLCSQHFRSLDPYMKNSDYLLGRKPSHVREEISRKFTEARKAVLPKKNISLYNLKDSFAVRFLSDESIESASGMKLNDLREILGHASLETTQRYLKALPYGLRVEGTIWDHF